MWPSHDPLCRVDGSFPKFFSGSKTGINNLDVAIRFEALQLDHLAGQLFNSNGDAHIENKSIPGFAGGGGLENQAHRLGDAHEIAFDFGMGDRDGTSGGDLSSENRDHAA